MPGDDPAIAFNNQAIALARQGQIDAAIQCFVRGLEAVPNHVMLLNNLAGLLCQAERFEAAAAISTRAVTAYPNLPDAHNHLGNALAGLRHYEQAVAAFRQALSLRSDFPDAHNNLARVFRKMNLTAAAIEHYLQAVQLHSNSADFLHNLAEAYCADRQYDQAILCCREALALNPNDAQALDTLGAAFRHSGDLTQSIAAHRAAVTLQPAWALFHNNLGIALHLHGELDQAIAHHRRAIELSPQFPLAHLNLGLALLSQGDYPAGWPEYEWRLRSDEYRLPTTLTRPAWDGGDLGGRTVLVHTEQGFGDMLQFVRYLPLIAERHGRVILACPKSLHRLFRACGIAQEMIAPDEILPEHDVQCALMSLPRIFQTTLDTILKNVPYLAADPALAAQWTSRLGAGGGLKVGLLWANQPNPPDRCPPPAAYAVLNDLGGVWFCSLQKDKSYPAPPLPITDWTAELSDFADTAALISHLDLIITVDTAVAHLAGAMGKPVWLLLRFLPDWRWLLDRADSPWYPTARLFRQPRLGDWQTPMARIAGALREGFAITPLAPNAPQAGPLNGS